MELRVYLQSGGGDVCVSGRNGSLRGICVRRRASGHDHESGGGVVLLLSKSTEAWDRGGKFEQYRRAASLRETRALVPGTAILDVQGDHEG